MAFPPRRAVFLFALLLGVPTACARPAASPTAKRFDPDCVPDAFARPVGALQWPGATRAILVDSRGDLDDGAWRLTLDPVADGVTAKPPLRIASEDRWLPVLHWVRESGAVRWEFEAVAAPAPAPGPFEPRGAIASWLARRVDADARRRADAELAAVPAERADRLLLRTRRPSDVNDFDRAGILVSLEIRATNRGTLPMRAQLDAQLVAPDPHPAFLLRDVSAEDDAGRRWAHDSAAATAVAWSSDGDSDRAFTILPGDTHVTRFVLSAYPLAPRTLAQWANRPHAERANQARVWWTHEVARGAAFSLGDPAVEDAVRAARVVLLSLRERRGDHWTPIGGPFHYRDVWLRDGARSMQALAVSGYLDEARAMAPAFLAFQWPNGPFTSQNAQMDGTGQALWTFDQVLLRGPASGDLDRYTEAAVRAWRWFERRRAAAPGPGDFAGLLPRTDPHDDELVRAQLVGNDAWAIAGYRATEHLLRASGRAALADTVARSRARYERDFRRVLASEPGADIPPSWQGVGRDWGNLAVAWPCGAIAPDDPRAVATAHDYWRRGHGFPLGFYGDPDSLLHGYIGADLGTWALLAGDRADADRVLDALLEWRNATGGAGETFVRPTRDFGTNLPPHPTSAAALLTLVRNAVIEDDGERLQLTLGARARWWRGAVVRRAPTRWGTLDLEFRSDGRTAEWRWTPVPVWTELTLPPGTRRTAALAPPLLPGSRPDVVLCPPRLAQAMVAIEPVGRPPAGVGLTDDVSR